MIMVHLLQWLFIFVVLCYCFSNVTPDEQSRIYDMSKLSGPGCPYTASWLSHVNLYRQLTWYLDITKMEAASFVIFDKAKLKFQMADPDSYYVHHMSSFEHLIHNKYDNFDLANNKTIIMSHAAFNGECGNLKVSKSKEYMALIPFYGGRPPNVTKDLAVRSRGEGNSLVEPVTKARLAIATICSCLKYFGHVTVGVARLEDRLLINDAIDLLSAQARHRINVIQFRMNRPSHLPFHLLSWGQHYVKRHNCQHFYYSNIAQDTISGADSSVRGRRLKEKKSIVEDIDNMNVSAIPTNREEFHICYPNAIAKSIGTPINVTYTKKNEASFALRHTSTTVADGNSTNIKAKASSGKSKSPFVPIKYIYFSECDQIVHFDDETTLLALTAASNETTFFTGRRREKAVDSNPEAYMSNLDSWRNCGARGYSLIWPRDKHVQLT